MKRILALLVLLHLISVSAAGTAETRLRLATTTSTEDSGLLDHLHPAFTAATGIAVDVIAVGSGKALALARNGDVDVVLAHDPVAEEAFVADGAGIDRRAVMANDFVIVGPPADPAGVRGATGAVDAFGRIAHSGAAFVSRGDQSGTHVKELAIFAAAGIAPTGPWYLAAGQGMGPVLQMADERPGYTLADRGTWLARRGRLGLALLHAGDPLLLNPYHVIRVNPARHPHVAADAARAYADYLTGPDGQALIDGFRIERERLFVPRAAH